MPVPAATRAAPVKLFRRMNASEREGMLTAAGLPPGVLHRNPPPPRAMLRVAVNGRACPAPCGRRPRAVPLRPPRRRRSSRRRALWRAQAPARKRPRPAATTAGFRPLRRAAGCTHSWPVHIPSVQRGKCPPAKRYGVRIRAESRIVPEKYRKKAKMWKISQKYGKNLDRTLVL